MLDYFFTRPWHEFPLVAIDTETTGQYPFTSEICEIAAVKYFKGEVIDRFQSFVAISKPMDAAVIAIHGIKNEMLIGAPTMDEVLPQFLKFVEGCLIVAHHAPFDVGFLAWELEKRGITFPELPAACTSLMSRKLIQESPNHKLQTLITVLGLTRGQAHRALDDAQACLELALKCFTRLRGETIDDIFSVHEPMFWERFSFKALESQDAFNNLIHAQLNNKDVEIQYDGGSRPGTWRRLVLKGLCRSPDGDFLVGEEPGSEQVKRYYFNRVRATRILG